MSVTVEAVDESGDGLDLARLIAVIVETLAGEGIEAGQLDLTFVDEMRMSELNAEHMGADGPTDVLAFPLDDEPFGITASDGDGETPPVLLGDVVICPTVARRQAEGHAGSEAAEFTLLCIHGTLHILGHDHAEPDETEVMKERERRYMAHFGFSHPG